MQIPQDYRDHYTKLANDDQRLTEAETYTKWKTDLEDPAKAHLRRQVQQWNKAAHTYEDVWIIAIEPKYEHVDFDYKKDEQRVPGVTRNRHASKEQVSL